MPKAKATVTEAADVIDAVKGAVEPSKKVVQRKGQKPAAKPKTEMKRALDAVSGVPAKVETEAETKAEDLKETVAETVEEAVKAAKEKTLFHGFEVKDGTDLGELEELTAVTSEGLEAIHRKDKDLIGHYLHLGEFQSKASAFFISPKVYGQFLKDALPASQLLDAPLRSNCKWLWEALNKPEHEASDILTVLWLNRIEDYKSANPTVIRRDWKAASAAAALHAEAEAEGMSEEQLAEVKKAEKEAKAQAEAEETGHLIEDFIKVADREALGKAFWHALLGKKADAIGFMQSLLPVVEGSAEEEDTEVEDAEVIEG